jgi:anti-sigma B factor antagonist
MNLKITTENGRTIASLDGRLDTTNSEDFEKAMTPLMTGNAPDIVLDCKNFSYISSSGLRLFLTLQKSVIARGGKLEIINMIPAIKEVFDMTGFSKIFKIIG